ncbi:MAG: ATP-dependent nuclease [Christensenellales bacterium]|jgi:energy-coupling factor transporter ATP-binding protein EcfA2
MSIETDNHENEQHQTPQVYFKNIVFNDGTKLDLQRNSIVVFTGPNNCGKSQALKDLERELNPSVHANPIVVQSTDLTFEGKISDSAFLNSRFILNNEGRYQTVDSNRSTFTLNDLESFWKAKELHNGMHGLFVVLLSTKNRLTASNPIGRTSDSEYHPIFKIFRSEETAQKISNYFHQAFGIDLVVNHNELEFIPLHTGQAPDASAYRISEQDYYYSLVNTLPKLHEQGDGMRAFASILLDTFTTNNTITLIDEPEAFLHPPQARIIGKMLAKNNPDNRQLFISTHSEDFLQGLVDANSENVSVIRIIRDSNRNNMSILNNNDILKLWGKPLLRYSNMLSGLFHEKVIVCESDYDCLFYQAIMDAMYESRNETSPDILFTHCGGKSRIKEVVEALRAVNVPVVAICDFDILNSSQEFKPLVAAFGLDWNSQLAHSMKTIYDGVNGRSNAGVDEWERIKKFGKNSLHGNEPAAYENIEKLCHSVGLYIVPYGEIESFDKTINKQKREWVYHVLENYELSSEPKLNDARRFIQSFVDFYPVHTLHKNCSESS